MNDPVLLKGPERDLLTALDEMLGHPDFLFPLVTAQRQYRDHYYGLSSAALLEDLFYDTFSNFLAQYRPGLRFERPGRGQKGWDYRFEGMAVSHKVGLKPQAIAALWDATVQADTWTFDFPVAYLCAGYEPGVGSLRHQDQHHSVKPLSGRPDEAISRGHVVWLVDWPVTGPARVVWQTQAATTMSVADLLPFDVLWPKVVEHIRTGVPANRLEVLRSTKAINLGQGALEAEESATAVEFTHRSGISLFVAADLVNVPVVSNNRALLLAKDTVAQKMSAALERGLFVPMPLWFRLYAAERPPDLYLTQRAEFDAMFSPARRSPPVGEDA